MNPASFLKEFDTRVREFELSFKEKGFYNIIVIDKAGNENWQKFVLRERPGIVGKYTDDNSSVTVAEGRSFRRDITINTTGYVDSEGTHPTLRLTYNDGTQHTNEFQSGGVFKTTAAANNKVVTYQASVTDAFGANEIINFTIDNSLLAPPQVSTSTNTWTKNDVKFMLIIQLGEEPQQHKSKI